MANNNTNDHKPITFTLDGREVAACAGETIWQAQRNHAPPDGAAYLECIRRR